MTVGFELPRPPEAEVINKGKGAKGRKAKAGKE